MKTSSRPLVLAAALVAVTTLSACGQAPSAFIVVQFDEAWEVDRLSFVLIPEGEVPLPQLTRPETPQGPLSTAQSLRVLLPQSSVGKDVALTVVAFSGEAERGRRNVRFVAPSAEEAQVSVDFTVAPGKGGGDGCEGGVCTCADAFSCPGGQRCEDGVCVCDAESCPNGCCDGDTCRTRSAQACGAAGEPCFDCGSRANNCGPGGSCQCGAAGPCAAGQRCAGGQCLCDAQSCSGCCLGQVCEVGTSPDGCGAGGIACAVCPTGDSCDDGACSSCNETTCPDGCCTGATCQPRAFGTCGVGGDTCEACNPLTADACSEGGACGCGMGPACGDGLQCVEGECRCTPESCGGCCDGNTCRPGTTDAQCGAAGAACGLCGGGNTCQGGECRCGSNPPCLLLCVMGNCLLGG